MRTACVKPSSWAIVPGLTNRRVEGSAPCCPLNPPLGTAHPARMRVNAASAFRARYRCIRLGPPPVANLRSSPRRCWLERFHDATVAREELLARIANLLPRPDDPVGPRQTLEHLRAVAARHHPAVEQHDGAHVRAAADQTPESLF